MVAAIIILYHPDESQIQKLIDSATSQVATIFAIDNTPNPNNSLKEKLEAKNIKYHALGNNYGIAKAHNVGIDLAIKADHKHVLLLDQDSLLTENFVNELLSVEKHLLQSGENVAAVGPVYIDVKTQRASKGIRNGFLGTANVDMNQCNHKAVKVDQLIASGSLIRTSALAEIGGMEEFLFIDAVDIEWCSRAKAKGFHLYMVPSAVMNHSIGDRAVKILGKSIILHSDTRNYYIIRNYSNLLLRGYVHPWWKLTVALKIPCYLVIYSWCSNKKFQAFSLLLRAVTDGFSGNLGRARSTERDQLLNSINNI